MFILALSCTLSKKYSIAFPLNIANYICFSRKQATGRGVFFNTLYRI